MTRVGNYLIIIAVGLMAQVYADNGQCLITYTYKPPFWVVSGDKSTKGMDYEYFRDGKKKRRGVLPKGSIVILDPSRPKIKNQRGRGEYLPIIVVSTLDDKKKKEKRRIARSLSLAGYPVRYYPVSRGAKRPQNGDKVYIYGGTPSSRKDKNGNEYIVRRNPSMVPPGMIKSLTSKTNATNELVLVVKKDALFFKVDGIEKFDQGHSLSLKVKNGSYQIKKCPDPQNPKQWITNYFFEVHKLSNTGNRRTITEFSFNPFEECSLKYISSLMPVSKDFYANLFELSRIEGLLNPEEDSSIENQLHLREIDHLVQIPQANTIEKIGTECYTKGPYGSYHYLGVNIHNCKTNYARREQASDSMLRPDVACAFVNGVLKKLQESDPAINLQWGDSFWPSGKTHLTHDKGNCIDIRPLKKDNSLGPCQHTWKKTYDRQKTKKLIEYLFQAGASKILFDDQIKIDPSIRGISSLRRIAKVNHSTHLHVCFLDARTRDLRSRIHQQEIARLKKKRRQTNYIKSLIVKHQKKLAQLEALYQKMKSSCFN